MPIYYSKHINKALEGQEVLFSSIPDSDWDKFWMDFEGCSIVDFNEECTGFKRKINSRL
jgi:hypothetical protein